MVYDKKNESNPNSSSNLLQSLPIFNNDKNFFTPSFILEMDKVLIELNSEKMPR